MRDGTWLTSAGSAKCDATDFPAYLRGFLFNYWQHHFDSRLGYVNLQSYRKLNATEFFAEAVVIAATELSQAEAINAIQSMYESYEAAKPRS